MSFISNNIIYPYVSKYKQKRATKLVDTRLSLRFKYVISWPWNVFPAALHYVKSGEGVSQVLSDMLEERIDITGHIRRMLIMKHALDRCSSDPLHCFANIF